MDIEERIIMTIVSAFCQKNKKELSIEDSANFCPTCGGELSSSEIGFGLVECGKLALLKGTLTEEQKAKYVPLKVKYCEKEACDYVRIVKKDIFYGRFAEELPHD